ncbi:hypothetical protein Cgig2_024894 [Carnegiea gigantea]|uniref:Uncharacterized protein n=1 Tax=Carnegiea gigantea TaxID=171969 RepID=A0A9Q1QI39_9CARY|nr:hypothetical protein Cgig2_024894 [Carnegiea gigantea]
MEPDINPPTQPPSLKLSEPLEPLVRQPPVLSSSTQVPQPHRPITPPHRPITPVLSPSMQVPQPSSGVPWPPTRPIRPPTRPIRPPTTSTRVVTRASAEAFRCSGEQTGVPRPPTHSLQPPTASTTAVTGASTEAFRRSGEIAQQRSNGGSKPIMQDQIVQRLTRSTAGSKQIVQKLGQPTSLNEGSESQPTLQSQPGASVAALWPVHMPTSQIVVGRPLVCPSTIRFGPFQPSSATIGSNPPCQAAVVVGTSQTINPTPATVKVARGGTQQEVHQKTGSPSQASRESPSNGNKEDLARSSPSQSIDKEKGHVGGKQKKISMSKSTRSSRLSWKDNIQFDAKEEVLTIAKFLYIFWPTNQNWFWKMFSNNDQGNEEVINRSILHRDVMNYKQAVRFCVAFNNYNQPIRKGGYIFVRFLGYIARLERFCPIGTSSWHKLNKTYKAGIVEMVRVRLWLKLVEMHELRKRVVIQLVLLVTLKSELTFLLIIFILISLKLWWNEASAKVQERLLSSSPSKTQVEIENELFDELMYEEENPKRPIDFGFNVDRSDVFGVNSILRKRGYIFPDNNMELKRVKEKLASQKAMFLLMLKAVHNGKITDEFLDATEAALRIAVRMQYKLGLKLFPATAYGHAINDVPQESSGNNLSNESGPAGPSTSASQVN